MKLKIKNKTIKGIVIGTVLSGIIFGGIGVSAVTLTANEIKYTPSDEKITATNAKEALDEIYKLVQSSNLKYKDITYRASVAGDPGSETTTIDTGVTVKGAGLLTCSITYGNREGNYGAHISNITWSGTNVYITMESNSNYQRWYANGTMRVYY